MDKNFGLKIGKFLEKRYKKEVSVIVDDFLGDGEVYCRIEGDFFGDNGKDLKGIFIDISENNEVAIQIMLNGGYYNGIFIPKELYKNFKIHYREILTNIVNIIQIM